MQSVVESVLCLWDGCYGDVSMTTQDTSWQQLTTYVTDHMIDQLHFILMVLGESSFYFRFRFIIHRSQWQNWMIERKRK